MNISLRQALKKKFDRLVYKYALLNRLLRNINKKLSGYTTFRLRPFGVMTVCFKSGIKFKMATNETSSVTKLLFWNGADNYEYTGIFEHLLPQGNTFMDIGANTGYYSLLAAIKNPGMQVFAFEPASAPFHFLQKNILINQLKNIKAFPIALSDTQGQLEFFELNNPVNYHSQYNLAGTGTLKGLDLINQHYLIKKVPTTTLDSWIQSEKINRIDLVKIDTEGTENLILLGASQLLGEHEPIIICETLFNVIEDKLDNIMRRFDYHFFNYKNGKLYKTETLVRKTDNGYRDCFFVPSKKIKWIEPFICPDC